jgi:DNA polymerase-3 subunit delta
VTAPSGPAGALLSQGGKGGVFYLHGDDDFRKEETARALVEAHLDPASADFNHDLLRGDEVDVETLASILATPPMMAEWRVVTLKSVEGLARSSRARDLLVGIASDPPPGLALILLRSGGHDSRAKFYRELAKAARDLAFPEVGPDDVPGWLMERARSVHGLTMEPEAARALGAAVGTNLGLLARELDKLRDVAEAGASITVETVKAAGTVLPTQDRWRWFDRVGERRFEEALDALPVLLDQGESGVGLVIGLSTHLLRLGIVRDLGLEALKEAVPRNQKWVVSRMGRALESQARGWPPGELEEALVGLLRVDRLLKSSALSDLALVEEWLLARLAVARGRAA